MSLLFIVNKHTGYRLSTTTITKLYHDLIELGFMEENCFISDADGILNYLGLKCKYTNRHEPPKYKTSHKQIEILCLKYPSYKHFVVGDGYGNIAYNPMGLTASGSYLHSKRIFNLL
jgi:hypothetical protein